MNSAENEVIKLLEKLCRAADTTKEPQSISVKALRRLGVLIKKTLNIINRQQAVIGDLRHEIRSLECEKGQLEGTQEYLIEQAKAEAAEVKHGEWIKHKPDPEAIKKWHALGIAKGMSENSIFWTCSCCKEWGTPAHKYCSQCGAKMDGKGEGAKE